MNSQQELAVQYISIAPDLKEAARWAGEVRGEQLAGIIGPILTGLGAAPLYVIRGPAEKFGKWMDDSEDKMEPISAVIGGTGATIVLITTGVFGGPLIALGVGVVGGPILGIAAWKGLKLGTEALAAKANELLEKAKEAAKNRANRGGRR